MKDYKDFIVDADQYDGWFSVECQKCKEYLRTEREYLGDTYMLYRLTVAEILELIEAHDCNS